MRWRSLNGSLLGEVVPLWAPEKRTESHVPVSQSPPYNYLPYYEFLFLFSLVFLAAAASTTSSSPLLLLLLILLLRRCI